MEFPDVFKKFNERFKPDTAATAPLRLTMAELNKVFSSFYPLFSEEELYNKMIEYGYEYGPENRSGTINFYWYLREARP